MSEEMIDEQDKGDARLIMLLREIAKGAVPLRRACGEAADRLEAVLAENRALRVDAYNPNERLREVTPAMASAGMHILAEMPDYCDWTALAKYAAVIWRAMYDAALSPLLQGDDT